MTATIHHLANKALDLIRCGLSAESAIETALAGERISNAERERIVQMVDDQAAREADPR